MNEHIVRYVKTDDRGNDLYALVDVMIYKDNTYRLVVSETKMLWEESWDYVLFSKDSRKKYASVEEAHEAALKEFDKWAKKQ